MISVRLDDRFVHFVGDNTHDAVWASDFETHETDAPFDDSRISAGSFLGAIYRASISSKDEHAVSYTHLTLPTTPYV